MLQSVEGYWLNARVLTGEYAQNHFHVFPFPGRAVYATIALSGVNHFPTEPDLRRRAQAYIARWTVYDEVGNIVAPEPNSMGEHQNAAYVERCATLEFVLEVANWVDATAQVNIFALATPG
jgi:hypothetical protein